MELGCLVGVTGVRRFSESGSESRELGNSIGHGRERSAISVRRVPACWVFPSWREERIARA